MSDTNQAPPPTTRRDLATRGLDALDPAKAGLTTISHSAGGVTFGTAMEVMEFAKLMAVADVGVPPFLRNNPGACMRVVFQAIEWRMSPFAVADKAYEVNGRMAYESQLIHAVIEARAPLQKRLNCEYAGEGPTRTCTVIGNFTDGDTRTYTTPELQKIKVKNSPLWAADPDQQLFYYASRAWARKWCPDVLMGIYSKEELRENPELGDRDDGAAAGAGLTARLAGAARSDEGHRPGHAASELDQIAPGGGGIVIEGKAEPAGDNAGAAAGEQADDSEPKDGKKKKRAKGAEKPPTELPKSEEKTPTPAAPPKTSKAYVEYATAWIKESKDIGEMNKRWSDEKSLRNDCGMTFDDRQPLDKLLVERREQLS